MSFIFLKSISKKISKRIKDINKKLTIIKEKSINKKIDNFIYKDKDNKQELI